MLGSATGQGPKAAYDIAHLLKAVVKDHIEQLRKESLAHPMSADMYRQHRESGFGMIRMLAAYHDTHRIADRECVLLALELQEACRQAMERLGTAYAPDTGNTGKPRQRGPRWRKGVQRGGGGVASDCCAGRQWRATGGPRRPGPAA